MLNDNGFQVPQSFVRLRHDANHLTRRSNSILRHLGRKYNLFGADAEQATFLDFFNDGVRL